jgi:hypothetical protein
MLQVNEHQLAVSRALLGSSAGAAALQRSHFFAGCFDLEN